MSKNRSSIQYCMAIANVELMQERFPKHESLGTARMKQDKENEEVDMMRRINI